MALFFKHYVLPVFFLAFHYSSFSQSSIAEWTFPNNPDDATVDVFDPVNTGVIIFTQGGTGAAGFSQAGFTTRSANATGWDNGLGLKCWQINISTTGFSNLSVSSRQYSSSTGPRDFKIQYRIGAGLWTDLPGATSIVLAANWTSGRVYEIALPAACNNQASVSLRWIMISNTSVGGGTVASGGNSRIDDVMVAWHSDKYYRSVISGNWNNITTWESSPDNITWNPAVMPPSSFSRTISIRNGHVVTVNSDINLDETIIDAGGELLWNSSNLDIYNGAGTDLLVNGTFNDDASNNVNFQSGATWQMGVSSTYIKSNNGSANNWRDNYETGIINIPASATWIIRKTNTNNPSVSSLLMYYPNLIIENNTAGNWIATGPSSFQGASSTSTVKGSMNIGGTGIGTVEFENTNTFASETMVYGDLIIVPGNTLRNFGTGFELFSDLICNGTLTYDTNGGRRIKFSGTAPQFVTGTGAMNIFDLIMNKSAGDVTLSRTMKIDNNITFNIPGGRIFSSMVNPVIIADGATATTANNTSFVHGPVSKLGNQAFTFPVGKNNYYRPAGIGTGVAGSSVFWTEDFSTGCNTGLLANAYSGVNGSWNITNTGINESSANTWYVSAAENGNGAGACGSGCGSNRTLHLSSTAFGDLGAAYFESDPFTCSFLGLCSITDKRAESPVINCSGRTGITLSMNYMEYGEGTNDNATLWYYDGSLWSQLVDLPKTLCCSGTACTGSTQGLWTAYSIALPASANNNPNVRIGFRWVNNANGTGTDPSFAVDDVRLSSPVSSESFTAEYFYSNPQTDFNNVVNPFIDHISQCEYWVINRNSGTAARTVTLSWDVNSCGVTSLPDLTTARFNGASWDDRGNGGTTGNLTSGTITTAVPQTLFGPFTLASTTPLNPLPVTYLNMEAICRDNRALIKWSTATEHNSDYFLILKSTDGINYNEAGRINAAGNSNTVRYYEFFEKSDFVSNVYWKIAQFDFDGSMHVSPVFTGTDCMHEINNSAFVWFNSAVQSAIIEFNSRSESSYKVIITDATGKQILDESGICTAGYSSITIPFVEISKGIYFVNVLLGNNVFNHKLFVR